MNKRRSLIAFLLTLALPYAAAASIAEGLRCHHTGVGALVAAAAPTPHDRGSMQHAHDSTAHAHHAAAPAGHDPGFVECDCAHHCAGSGGAALASHALDFATDSVERPMAGYTALARQAWDSPAFRPPIAAPPSAA